MNKKLIMLWLAWSLLGIVCALLGIYQLAEYAGSGFNDDVVDLVNMFCALTLGPSNIYSAYYYVKTKVDKSEGIT